MNKAYILALALLLPVQVMAIEKDSVYTWGAWAEGIQPAAGPVAKVTPPPAQTPNVNFRANENSALLREAVATSKPALPIIPSAPQHPEVVVLTGGGFASTNLLP